MKCDKCGITANVYRHDLYTGKMICLECDIREEAIIGDYGTGKRKIIDTEKEIKITARQLKLKI